MSGPNKLTRGYSQYASVPLPERWPLVSDLEQRSELSPFSEKDSRLVNCFAEFNPKDSDWQLEKRPGYALEQTVSVGAIALGMYSWDTGAGTDIYSVFNATLYKNGVAMVGVLNNGSTYHWNQILSATKKLVLKNRSQMWFTDGAALTQVVDVDYPALTVTGMAYLDGTTYVMRPDGGIQGSAIDDVSSWDPLNVIIARNEPDLGVVIVKHQTYVYAFKQWSIQGFYNAGNPTGSPLTRLDGANYMVGCRSGESLAEMDGIHYWITANKQKGVSRVGKLDNGQLSYISTPIVDRWVTVFGNGASGRTFEVCGHKFYAIALNGTSFKLVYDITSKLWYYWNNWDFFDYAGDINGAMFAQAIGKIFEVASCFQLSTDDNLIVPCDIYTGNFDFGVDRIKNLNKLTFDADIVQGSFLDIRNSDDDYSTWTPFRRVDLGQNIPWSTKEGSFYQRAYHLRHNSATPFRIRSLGLQIDIGTT